MSAPHHHHEREVIELLESSVIVAGIDRMRSAIVTAANDSAAMTIARGAVAAFVGFEQHERRRLTSIALGVAIVAHLALTIWRGPRADLFWLLVPAIAAVMTAVVAISARGPGRR